MSYFTVQDEQQKLFTQLPKALLYETKYKKMSNDSKVLYSFLLDRNYLSLQNNWKDEFGRIYIKCNEIAMGEILNKSEKTARRFKKELIEFGLLEPLGDSSDKTKYYLHKPDVTVEKLEEYVGVFTSKVKEKVEKEKERNKEYRLKVARNKITKIKDQLSNGNNDRSIENTGFENEKMLNPLETLATVETTDCDQSKLPFSNNDFSNTDFKGMYVCTGAPAKQSNSLFVDLYEKYLLISDEFREILPSYEEHIDLELYESLLLEVMNKFKIGRVSNPEKYLMTTLDARVVKGQRTLADYVAYKNDFVEHNYRNKDFKNPKKKSSKQNVPKEFPEVPEVPARKTKEDMNNVLDERIQKMELIKANGLNTSDFMGMTLAETRTYIEEKQHKESLIEEYMERYNPDFFDAETRRRFAMKDLGLL